MTVGVKRIKNHADKRSFLMGRLSALPPISLNHSSHQDRQKNVSGEGAWNAEEVARSLREADHDLAKRLTISDICRKQGIAEAKNLDRSRCLSWPLQTGCNGPRFLDQ
jgi:hypothetical protein